MADLTRSASASMDASTGMYAVQVTGLLLGEDCDAVDAMYIKTADGLLWVADGSAADEEAEFIGFTPRAGKAGQPMTVYSCGARFRYGTGLSPGAKLYLSATEGILADAASTGGVRQIAVVINTTDILCVAAYSHSAA
jgi:hypothetical protein